MSKPLTLIEIAKLALEEDVVGRDVTTASLDSFLKSRSEALPERLHFYVGAKEKGVFSGAAWARAVCELMDLRLESCLEEGASIAKGTRVCVGSGSTERVLAAERTLLNGLQYSCGVATYTQTFSECIRLAWTSSAYGGEAPGLYHTRKTPPLLRELGVAAVLAGGGKQHRLHLADRILFKENHKYFVTRAGLRLEDYVSYLETWGFEDAIIEVESCDEAWAAAKAGARHLLLDNFSPDDVRRCLTKLTQKIEIEVSGGLTLETIPSYCIPGVTRFSVGSLTRDVRSIDLSLDWSEDDS